MIFRPEEAHWFELYVPREQTVYAIEALAGTNLVQLEIDPHTRSLDLSELKRCILQFEKLMERYSSYLPLSDQFPTSFKSSPDEEAVRSLKVLNDISVRLDLIREKKSELIVLLENLQLLREFIDAHEDSRAILSQIAHRTDFLFKGIYACPHSCCMEEDDEIDVSLSQVSHGVTHDFYLIADIPVQQSRIDEFFHTSQCSHVSIPEWLLVAPGNLDDRLSQKIKSIQQDISQTSGEMHQFANDLQVGQAISNLELLKWYVDHAHETSIGKKLCHITGWSVTGDASILQKTLAENDIHSVVRFSTPPIGTSPPVTTLHSWWSRPFQLFTTMLGTPGHEEVDPGVILPFVVPLLFGYMFPDVGHGIMLTLASLLLYKRWPAGRFLMPCGVVATLFGFLFGELFGIEGAMTPVWVHPLDDPIVILIAPIVFGVILMLLGLIFNGVEFWWRSEFRSWLMSDAAVLTLYASALVSVAYSYAVWAVLVSLIWYVIGSLLLKRQDPFSSFFTAIGCLLQSMFELLVNTFSFLRVGAFALAHAALTSGFMEVISDIENSFIRLTVLVIFHSVFVIIEGFIVFVQTTRLVLFEFFIRFLRAEGRIFKPITHSH